MTDTREKLLDAALAHVPFDGWSDATFQAAIDETGVAPGLARGGFSRAARSIWPWPITSAAMHGWSNG